MVTGEGNGGSEGDLDFLGCTHSDAQAVFLLHEFSDGLVEFVTTDPRGLAGHHSAKGDDRNLGGSSADVDDHRTTGSGDVEACADRSCDGFLNHIGGRTGSGVLGCLLHSASFNTGDS